MFLVQMSDNLKILISKIMEIGSERIFKNLDRSIISIAYRQKLKSN